MNTSGSGGFLLHAIKVYAEYLCVIQYNNPNLVLNRYDDPNASSVLSHRQKAKKAKLEAQNSTTLAVSTNDEAELEPVNVSQELHTESIEPVPMES